MFKDDSKNTFQGRIRGIGLLELSIFVVCFGALVMAGAPIYEIYETHKHMDVTNASVAQVQTALDAYYQKNGTFPCPAPLNAGVDGPGFATARASCADVVGRGRLGGDIGIGAVPTRTLGLSDSAGIDGWNHLLTYAVTKKYTALITVPKDMIHGEIYISDSNGNPATQLYGNAVYAVAVANPNGAGAYGLNGLVQSPCAAATGLTAKICNANGTAVTTAASGPFISTTLQGSQTSRYVSNAMAIRADTCTDPSGFPVPGACGTYISMPWPAPWPNPPSPPAPGYCTGNSYSYFTTIAGATPATPGWTWTCDGSCQAPNALCSTDLCVPVPAACGSSNGGVFPSPPAGLCPPPPPTLPGPPAALGAPFLPTPPGVSTGATTYNWTCMGSCYADNGPPDHCSTNPACIGATSPACSALICTKINAACGPSNGGSFTSAPSGPGLCASGISGSVSGSGGPTYSWTCAGDCSAHSPPGPPPDCTTNPACIGNPQSCSASCVSDGVCTAATVAALGCSSSAVPATCTDNCGKVFTATCKWCSEWFDSGSVSPGWLPAGSYLGGSPACGMGWSCTCPPLGSTCGAYPIGVSSTWWPVAGEPVMPTPSIVCGSTADPIKCHGRIAVPGEISSGICSSINNTSPLDPPFP